MLTAREYTVALEGDTWQIFFNGWLLWSGTNPDDGMAAVVRNDHQREGIPC